MSQLAIFYLLDTSKLEQLNEHAEDIDHYDEYLENNAILLYGMKPDCWNAPPFIAMTHWMTEEKDIDFFEGPYEKEAGTLFDKSGTTTFIWSTYHRDALKAIDVEALPDEELKRIAIDYHGDDSDEDLFAMKDAVRVMREVLERVEEGKVVVVLIA